MLSTWHSMLIYGAAANDMIIPTWRSQVLLRFFHGREEDDRRRLEADQEGDGQDHQAEAAPDQGGGDQVTKTPPAAYLLQYNSAQGRFCRAKAAGRWHTLVDS